MIKALVFDAYGTLYDVQSVAMVIEKAFPGHGAYITQVWRLKQLEYSWLRSMMGRYADFWTVTREALSYTLDTLGLVPSPGLIDEVADAYNNLTPYPDADAALTGLQDYRLAILSNGNPAMLSALVGNSGLAPHFEAVLSVDAMRVYKPDPRAYEPLRTEMGLTPQEVIFVSSNGFDVAGAKAVGFRVARIERVPPATLQAQLTGAATIGPPLMYNALRTQEETFSARPDVVIGALSELPGVVEMF